MASTPATIITANAIKGQAGSGDTGGAVAIAGGVAGVTSAGGAVSATGGIGGATSGAGGAASVVSGAGTTVDVGGVASITGGAGNGTGACAAVADAGGVGGEYIEYKGDSYIDVDGAFGWQSAWGIGAEIGYRYMRMKVEDLGDIDTARLMVEGPYAALNYRF